MKMYTCYRSTDASLLEINPLILTKDERVIALDSKFNFDGNALFRQKEIAEMRDLTEAALAAQAVLARTWAIANSHRFKVDGYHLCSDTQCQVYKDPSKANQKIQLKQKF